VKRVIKPEMKLGADRKRIFSLGGLLVVLIVVWLYNRSDSPSPGPSSTAPAATAVTPAPGIRTPVRPATRTTSRATGKGRGLSVQEFHPTLKPRDPIDTTKVDPTLRLDLLTRLRNAKLEGGSRSLFDFSGAPAPAANQQIAKVGKIIPKPLEGALATGPTKPAAPKPPPAPPPPPTIPLKFYGYTNTQQRQGPKRAFFLEGEDIFVAGEGDTIKNRYKIIRIGVNSAVVEDTQFKNQQTLPLIEEMANS